VRAKNLGCLREGEKSHFVRRVAREEKAMGSCGNLPSIFPEGLLRLPGQPVCSRGACVQDTCVCETGWVGSSDLLNFKGFDCHINELALQILWICSLVICTVLWLRTIPHSVDRWKQFRALQKRKKGTKLFNNTTTMSLLSFQFFCIPAALAYTLIKIQWPQQRLGMDLPVTLCFFVTQSAFYVSIFYFQPFLLRTMLQTSKSFKLLVGLTFTFSLLNLGLSVLTAAIPLVAFLDGSRGAANKETSLFALLAYLSSYAFSAFLYALQAYFIMSRANKLLKKIDSHVYGAERVERMRKSIIDLETKVASSAALIGIIHVLFAMWPFLWNKLDYLIPLTFMSGVYTWSYLSFTAIPRAERATMVENYPQDKNAKAKKKKQKKGNSDNSQRTVGKEREETEVLQYTTIPFVTEVASLEKDEVDEELERTLETNRRSLRLSLDQEAERKRSAEFKKKLSLYFSEPPLAEDEEDDSIFV